MYECFTLDSFWLYGSDYITLLKFSFACNKGERKRPLCHLITHSVLLSMLTSL